MHTEYINYHNAMKKYLFLLLLLFCVSCNVQKHIQTERITTTNKLLNVTEKTDKNTTKFIVITRYKPNVDSITGKQPIESITEIKEINNDKVVSNTKEEDTQIINEQTEEETKTETNIKWYIVCFCAGIIITLIVIGAIKLLMLYVRGV